MSNELKGRGLPVNKTERRTSKPQTEGQRIASNENFALFLLKGIISHISNPRANLIFSRTFVNRVSEIVLWEISRIKDMQAMRKDKNHER
jgi:hypothetical protein